MRAIRSTLLIALVLVLGVRAHVTPRSLERHHLEGERFALDVVGDRVEVVVADDASTRVGFRLASVVAPDATTLELVRGAVRAAARDVTIDHGPVSALYTIGGRTVEQLFVLDAPPSRRRGTVIVRIEVSSLSPRFEGPDRIALVDSDGNAKLRYGVVRVRDSVGHALPAHVDVEHGELALRYDDRGAVYPVVVDPAVWSVGAELVPLASATDALFGEAVAADGDVLVVGAPDFSGSTGASQGAAYVFKRGASGFTQAAVLSPSTARAAARFGASVAVDVVGTRVRVVVGAPGDSNGTTTTGLAYVFEDSGAGTFQQIAQLTPMLPGITTSDRFGTSVGIDGDIVAVGAPDYGANREGGVEVFVKPAVGPFGAPVDLAQPVPAMNDRFGFAVAVSGTTIAVGAIGIDFGATIDFGAVLVFTNPDDTTWMNTATLPTAVDLPSASAQFGSSVALNATSLIVGAPGYNRTASTQAGAAYVFAADTFVGEATLYAPVAELLGRFGASVAIDGALHAVGSPGASVVSTGDGKAFVFARSGASFADVQPVSYEAASVVDDHFGTSVALAHVGSVTDLLAGAPGRTPAGVSNTGAVAVATFGSPLGDACGADAECALGFCVDGVCCNVACGGGDTGDCLACSTAAGGATNGVCGNRQTSACAGADGGTGGARFSDPRAVSCSAAPAPWVTRRSDTTAWIGVLAMAALVVLRRRAWASAP